MRQSPHRRLSQQLVVLAYSGYLHVGISLVVMPLGGFLGLVEWQLVSLLGWLRELYESDAITSAFAV